MRESGQSAFEGSSFWVSMIQSPAEKLEASDTVIWVLPRLRPPVQSTGLCLSTPLHLFTKPPRPSQLFLLSPSSAVLEKRNFVLAGLAQRSTRLLARNWMVSRSGQL